MQTRSAESRSDVRRRTFRPQKGPELSDFNIANAFPFANCETIRCAGRDNGTAIKRRSRLIGTVTPVALVCETVHSDNYGY